MKNLENILDIAKNCIGADLTPVKPSIEDYHDLWDYDNPVTTGPNGEQTIYPKDKKDGGFIFVQSYYPEVYYENLKKLLDRTGIRRKCWANEYDFNTIKGERLITQDDLDFLISKGSPKYTLEYFSNNPYCLVFNDNTILIEDTAYLAGRGYRINFETGKITYDWMS